MKNPASKGNSFSKGQTGDNKKEKQQSDFKKFFGRFSTAVTRATGGVYAFIVAIVVVIIWAGTGPIFKYSDTWQLVINTGTTIITFLMVFIIQHSQNKDTIALQLKLNELIAASQASNKLIDVEDLSDEELEKLQNKIHSIEEKKDEIKNVQSGKNQK